MKNMWEIRQNAKQPDAIDLYIYGDVEGDHYDWRKDELVRSETSAKNFRDALATRQDAAEIHIYINSYGGSVFEGTAIYHQLKRHPAHKTVHIDGFACSVASVIAMAGDTVIMPRNTLMMIHNMWMGACGNAAELRKAADDLDTINEAGRQAYLDKSCGKLTEQELTDMMDQETWLTAEQCIAYGLADKFAEEDADMSLSATLLNQATMAMEQRINLHKGVAAMLRALTAAPQEERITPTQGEAKTGIMQTIAGIFNE